MPRPILIKFADKAKAKYEKHLRSEIKQISFYTPSTRTKIRGRRNQLGNIQQKETISISFHPVHICTQG